jgi:hypothetical protein
MVFGEISKILGGAVGDRAREIWVLNTRDSLGIVVELANSDVGCQDSEL